MSNITIRDIYAGMPDARDEINTNQTDKFFLSFIVPPELPVEDLLCGKKFLIAGYKGVGKTSVLYYLQNKAQDNDSSACTSFIYFKSDFEEIKRSNLEYAAKKLTAIIDCSGEIQPNKVEYLHLWRWVFFKKIVDDCEENTNGLFVQNEEWDQFAKAVNTISFSSNDRKVISLSSLSIELEASRESGFGGKVKADFQRVSGDKSAYNRMLQIIDQCENLFKKLRRTSTPYYMFIDEIEAYYGDTELFKRDLTLIRDMIFTIHRINSYGKLYIIAAIRNEIVDVMDRFIQTREVNKILDGYSVPIKWSYSNTNSYDHPIIKILMRRISVAANGEKQSFQDWFPKKVGRKDTIKYILDNGWNKPRDIVRLLTAAQNDSIHCNDTAFSQAAFDSLRKEYSKKSLAEIRQELQSLYTNEEIEMVFRLLRGGPRIFCAETLKERASYDKRTLDFWNARNADILEDLYRVGLWGNVNRQGKRFLWRWNHKGDTGILTGNGWELVLHNAICGELSIVY